MSQYFSHYFFNQTDYCYPKFIVRLNFLNIYFYPTEYLLHHGGFALFSYNNTEPLKPPQKSVSSMCCCGFAHKIISICT